MSSLRYLSFLPFCFICLSQEARASQAWPEPSSLPDLCTSDCNDFHIKNMECHRRCDNPYRVGEIFATYQYGGLFFTTPASLARFLADHDPDGNGVHLLRAGHPLKALNIIGQTGGQAIDELWGNGYVWMAPRGTALGLPHYDIKANSFRIKSRRLVGYRDYETQMRLNRNPYLR